MVWEWVCLRVYLLVSWDLWWIIINDDFNWYLWSRVLNWGGRENVVVIIFDYNVVSKYFYDCGNCICLKKRMVIMNVIWVG